MSATQHLAEGQFHQREGRPNKREYDAVDEGESTAPRKAHVHTHKVASRKPRGHKDHHGRAV